MGVRFVGVVVMGGLGCDIFVLLDVCVILKLPVFCYVSGGELSPVASLSGVELVRHLRLVLNVLWCLGYVEGFVDVV